MKNKRLIWWSMLCLMAATGCFKDKGNYDLKPINEISFTTQTPDTIRISQFDTLRINTEVQQTMPDQGTHLVYRWNAYSAPNAGPNTEMGDQKDLKAAIGFKPGNYTLLYTITDPKTNVSFFKKFYMIVSSVLSEGWLVLERKADASEDVAIVTPGGMIISDLYRTANKKNLPAGTHTLRVLNTITEQHVFTYSNADAVQVDYSSFVEFNTLKDWFYQPTNPGPVEAHCYTKYAYGSFLVCNGNVYTEYVIPTMLMKYGAPIMGDWKISPFVLPMNSSGQGILFDTKNQRFLFHQAGAITTYSNPAGSAFNMNNVGKQLVYGGQGIGNYFNCVLKNNNDNQFFVYRINSAGTIAAAEAYTLSNAPGIANAKYFASSGLYLHIYYAVDNKLYLIDIPTQSARLVYTFPAGTEVTAMKLKMSMSLLVAYPDNNKTLCVGTNENNQGKVYVFSISNTGDFEGNTYSNVYTGFGRVLDVDYKNRK